MGGKIQRRETETQKQREAERLRKRQTDKEKHPETESDTERKRHKLDEYVGREVEWIWLEVGIRLNEKCPRKAQAFDHLIFNWPCSLERIWEGSVLLEEVHQHEWALWC